MAAFGEYCGYTQAQSKTAVQRAFGEFQKITDKDQIDLASRRLLPGESAASQQLRAFSLSQAAALHSYPEAFQEIQEYAFVTVSERISEGEHVKTKLATVRTMKYAKPAYTSARQRKAEIAKLVQQDMGWLVQQWASRKIFCTLLAWNGG